MCVSSSWRTFFSNTNQNESLRIFTKKKIRQ